MKLKLNRTVKGVILLILLVGTLQLVIKILLINSNENCGRFYRSGGVRSTITYHYKYYIGGKEYESSISEYNILSEFRSIDSLKKIECIKIKYSKWFPSFSQITDERLLK